MSKITLAPNASGTGTLTVAAPNTNSDYTLTLPAETGTVLTSGGAIDVNASAPADSLAIDASGNVGINTTSVSTSNGGIGKLFGIKSSANNVIVGETSGSGYNGIVLESRKTGRAADARLCQIGMYDDGAENGAIRFSTAPSGSAITERMRIDSSGNLLVGTTGLTSNGTRLTLSGSERVARIYGTTEGTAPVTIDKSSATTTTSQVYIQFSVDNQGSGCGQINANGASQAAFGSFSDQRLKENIVDLPPQLDNICALRPVEFDYIQSEGGGHQIGFVAQEMQEIYPDSIGVRQPDEMLTVTGWSKTEARLVKAIQELKAENDALKSRLDAVEALEARIAALEVA